jgi:cholesterol oxidase
MTSRDARSPFPALDRRQALALGGGALAAALLPGCGIPVAYPQRDLVDRAQANYRDSLLRQRRRVALPDGTEAPEKGTGALASAADVLAAAHNSRPGRPDFDVLIIGSGYGGAVCAARLGEARRPGVRIGVLERGREWVPGSFPSQLSSFNPLSHRPSWMGEQLSRNPLGLFGFYDRGDVEVVVGSGLGGSSLVNCAVAIEPDEAVFAQTAWPRPFRDKVALRPYFQRARRMLDARVTPEDRYPPKLRVHLDTAEALRRRGQWAAAAAYPAELAITFASRTNGQGMRQQGCVQCGDCTTGCNVGAKNSLDQNYLPLAWALGAELFTQVEVEDVERAGAVYRVQYLQRPSGSRGDRRGVVTASVLILAGGSLGSTEILLRSRRRNGLEVSDRLGRGFSANGNYLGFVDYQFSDPVVITNSAGVGVWAGVPEMPIGPTIQGIIDFRRKDLPMYRRVMFEDIAHPSAHAAGVALLMLADLNRAITLLGCGHDAAAGEIRLDEDGIKVRWPDYDRQASHAEMVTLMREYANAKGGRFRPFTPARNTTAHPLGGCRMGSTAAEGVVDDGGRVFDASSGAGPTAVHPGLYVIDAAIVPTALGNNPLLTITALAERAAELIVQDPTHAALFTPAVGAAPERRQSP